MGGHAKSMFSYNITQPYPFRWFTPVTVTGFAVLVVLLSWLNYGANGFDQVVTTTSDLNATISDTGMLYGLPSLLTGKTKPTCQPANIGLNSKFFTNKNALQYEILEISRPDTMPEVTLPALTYSNNVLENCSVEEVGLYVESKDRSTVMQIRAEFGILVNTYAYCYVNTLAGAVKLHLLSEYDHDSATVSSSFVDQNATTKASLWWAQSILETYWNWSSSNMRKQNKCPDGACRGRITKAYLRYRPREGSTTTDILDPHFLGLQWWTIVERNDSDVGVYWTAKDVSHYAFNYTEQKRFPETWWGPTEKLAKSAWSTVLVDLGVNHTSNILLDPNQLRDFTTDFVDAHNHSVDLGHGPERQPYNPSSTKYGSLGTSPSVINAVYVCSVPRRKSVGTLAWSIILADLVFLQALWVIFKLIVDTCLERKVTGAMSCEGCRKLMDQEESSINDPKTSSRSGSFKFDLPVGNNEGQELSANVSSAGLSPGSGKTLLQYGFTRNRPKWRQPKF